MKTKNLYYCGNCTDHPFNSDITEEIVHKNSKEVIRKTFLQYINVDDLKRLEKEFGYADHYKHGMVMGADPYVTYFTSYYKRHGTWYRVVFFKQSGIEYFFK